MTKNHFLRFEETKNELIFWVFHTIFIILLYCLKWNKYAFSSHFESEEYFPFFFDDFSTIFNKFWCVLLGISVSKDFSIFLTLSWTISTFLSHFSIFLTYFLKIFNILNQFFSIFDPFLKNFNSLEKIFNILTFFTLF